MRNDVLQGVSGASAACDRSFGYGRRRRQRQRVAVDAKGRSAGDDQGASVWSAGAGRTLVRRPDARADRQNSDSRRAAGAVLRRKWRSVGGTAQSDDGQRHGRT